MNLHAAVAGAISAINPLTSVTIRASAGYTTAADGTQVPTYAAPVTVLAQVQQLTAADLAQLDGLNIQGASRSVYLNGQWDGIVRPDSKGGTLLTFDGQTWLVVAVLEQWPDWTRLAVVLQNGG